MFRSKIKHPVKTQLLKLLAWIAAGAIFLLISNATQNFLVRKADTKIDEFHQRALLIAHSISLSLANIRMPPGMASGQNAPVSDEATFAAAINREYSRILAASDDLLTLYKHNPGPPFDAAGRRLERAIAELRGLHQRLADNEMEFLRALVTHPLYLEIVVQQTQSLHEESYEDLHERLLIYTNAAWWILAGLVSLFAVSLLVLARRTLHAIDGILLQEKTAKRALQDSEIRSRAIFESVTDGIVTLDDKGAITTLNPAARAIFGYEHGEVTGRSLGMLITENNGSGHDDESADAFWARQIERVGVQREAVGRRKDGSTVPIDYTISPLRITGHRMFAAVLRDISERKKMDEIKDGFISTVSHELRTPMTSIAGSLGLIQSGVAGELPEKAQNMVMLAYRNCKRLSGLLNDILDIARIGSGKLAFKLGPVDLRSVIEEVVDLNAPFAKQKRVTFHIQGTEQPALVLADYDRLIQVMTNLISNALKYSPIGETITVGVAQLPDGFRVSVADRGPGIPDAFKSQIFSRFARADTSNTRAKQGTGLGLSICKAIIEGHRGVIGFSSEEGKGATFFFQVPAGEIAAGAKDAA